MVVYTALQQGTIDGQENAVINIYPARLQEVQKYMSMTNHLLSFVVLLINENLYNSLAPDLQAAVRSCDRGHGENALRAGACRRDDCEDAGSGVEVATPDLAPFRDCQADPRTIYRYVVPAGFMIS